MGVLADQLIPTRLFLRKHQLHDDLIQDRRFGWVHRTDLVALHPTSKANLRALV
jgi:hypothetical protein